MAEEYHRKVNPLSDKGFKRLRDAVRASRVSLGPFRENRYELIRQFVGRHYADKGSKVSNPVNLMEMFISIYRRHLVSHRPRIMIDTEWREIKADALDFQIRLNNLIKEIDFKSSLESVVVDALFSVGLAKIGLYSDSQIEIDGYLHDYGQPFFDSIDLDDWVHDMNARSQEEFSFVGNKYRRRLDLLMEIAKDGGFDEDKVGQLEPSTNGTTTEEGEEEVGGLASGGDTGDYVDYVELQDIYLPYENLMITYPVHQDSIGPLRAEEWEGVERGPYRMLAFEKVPSSAMPLSSASILLDLHNLVNSLYRKFGRQAQRQKDVTAYRGAQAKDGERLRDSSDGDMIRVEDPAGLAMLSRGGVNSQNFAFAIDIINRFSWLAGNLDALGGLSAMSDTVGQDEMMMQNSSKRMQDMQDIVLKFTAEACEDIGWYLYTDPVAEGPVTKKIKGTDIEVTTMWGPEQREHDFTQYNFSIEPYSMAFETPQSQMNKVRQFIQEVVMPFMPQFEQYGISLDMEGLIRLYAKKMNMPEIEDFIIVEEPKSYMRTGPIQAVSPSQSFSPPTTQRETIRTNRSSGNRTGRDAAMAQLLMGGNPQEAEMGKMVQQ